MSALLLAAALLIAPAQTAGRARLFRLCPVPAPVSTATRGWPLPMLGALASGVLVVCLVGGLAGAVSAVPVGLATGWGTRRWVRDAPAEPPDPLMLAGGWDLLAACLRSGLPIPPSVRAIAEYLPAEAATQLRTIADRLALGADPDTAWAVPESSPVHRLARAARRSAHSGAGLAGAATRVAAELRSNAGDVAAAKGQRAGVLITGPLGLCFLPAFLVLGVVPVVIGLASGLAVSW